MSHRLFLAVLACVAGGSLVAHGQLAPLAYNDPDLVVDLGVGLWAWPLPMDFDADGDPDLVVVCPDKPSNGTYFFENVGGDAKRPLFRPGVRISRGLQNIQVSYVDGEPRVLGPGREFVDFRASGLETSRESPLPPDAGHVGKIRFNGWKYVDYDGDGAIDVMVGLDDGADYGWDDAFNEQGEWVNGPLHGYVYLFRNVGTTMTPEYDPPFRLQAGGQDVDVYGWPSPNLADFDADGDLDLLCGEFLDGFTYFENTGSRTAPIYAAGRRLMSDGEPLAMDLQMITPVAFDWDGDGDGDLIVGDEDGRVALLEHSGRVVDSLPVFLPPVYFQQHAEHLKFGALATPVGFDWDGDGDDDLLCGNTAGYIGWFENLSGSGVERPRWAAPQKLKADGKIIRIQAGPNGSIQGPCEAKWGYTTLTAGDWDGDGLPDLVVNSIWGRIEWYRNVGSRTEPALAAAQPVRVAWQGAPPKPAWIWWNPEPDALVTQWRTTPVIVDWNDDGLADLLMLDHEGYLAFFERTRSGDELALLPGRRALLDEQGEPLRLNDGWAGKSGRRKLSVVDWDGDGRLDVLVNSQNASLLRQTGASPDGWIFRDEGVIDERPLAGHTSSPTTVDFGGDGVPDLVVGAEDGRLYYARNNR